MMKAHQPGRRAPEPPAAGDDLPGWAARRESGRRLLVESWYGTVAVALAMGLLADRFLVVPIALAVATGCTVIGGRARSRWWRARRRVAGHPVARAAVPRTVARSRPSPQDWPETMVTGVLHVTGSNWRWVPSLMCTDDVAPQGWSHQEVTGLRYVPSWGPGLPRSGYLRLQLLDGDHVDLVVWDPELLGLLDPLPEEAPAPTGPAANHHPR